MIMQYHNVPRKVKAMGKIPKGTKQYLLARVGAGYNKVIKRKEVVK